MPGRAAAAVDAAAAADAAATAAAAAPSESAAAAAAAPPGWKLAAQLPRFATAGILAPAQLPAFAALTHAAAAVVATGACGLLALAVSWPRAQGSSLPPRASWAVMPAPASAAREHVSSSCASSSSVMLLPLLAQTMVSGPILRIFEPDADKFCLVLVLFDIPSAQLSGLLHKHDRSPGHVAMPVESALKRATPGGSCRGC